MHSDTQWLATDVMEYLNHMIIPSPMYRLHVRWIHGGNTCWAQCQDGGWPMASDSGDGMNHVAQLAM